MKLTKKQRNYLKIKAKEEIESYPGNHTDWLISCGKTEIDKLDDENLCDWFGVEDKEDLEEALG